MFLVNVKEKTIQKCTVLEKKTGYTVIQIGNEIFGLPAEDDDRYLCDTYERACNMLYGPWFVPQ